VRKWEKRILDGYDAIRTLIHEHVVPVLERISLVLSTLRGISIWYRPPSVDLPYRHRSNQSLQLPLDDTAIAAALDLHKRLFLRTFEILKGLMVERASFETFAVWLSMMADDVLAHEDSNPDPPPLHIIDTEAVAEYITATFPNPILGKYARDLGGVVQGEMVVDEEEAYISSVRGLMEVMKGYFRKAAGELRGFVAWVLPEWIDLEMNEEVVSSDMRIMAVVVPPTLSESDDRMEIRIFRLRLHCRRHMKASILMV
jgi:Anaphase-promoting complex, cyclosome, subunit 4